MKKIFIASVMLALTLAGCTLGGTKNVVITPEDASAKALKFINENLMQPGSEVTIKEIIEENGLYKMTVVLPGEGAQEITSYMTRDGKNFFPQAFEIDKEEANAEENTNTDANVNNQNTPAVAAKSDKPKVELFVMSHCPYGTQIEKGIIPVVETLGDKIDFELKFVDYAMHGEKELNEELQQYCVKQEAPDKFLSYLNCFLADGDTGDACFSNVGINKGSVDSCVAAADKEFKVMENFADRSTYRGSYPTFAIYQAENTKYGVGGSPTLIINGGKSSSGRDSASLLNAICGAFNNAPEECSTQLSSASPSPGFGFGATGAATDASCN